MDLVMREQNTKVPYFDIICTLCWSCWIGTGGSKPTPPQTTIFSHQCGGHLQPVGGGVKPPTPPTNRTLVSTSFYPAHLICVPSSLGDTALAECRAIIIILIYLVPIYVRPQSLLSRLKGKRPGRFWWNLARRAILRSRTALGKIGPHPFVA